MTWQDFKKLYCQLEGRKLFFELIKLKDKKLLPFITYFVFDAFIILYLWEDLNHENC